MRSKFTEFVFLFGLLYVSHSFPSSYAEFDICKTRYGHFPKPGSSCRTYYKCVEFTAIELECPEDQHFFPAKEYCVWPEEYPCLQSMHRKELISEKCPLPDGKFMKQNTRCKMYYQCRKGIPSEKRCEGELLFDPIRRECEYPEYVTCPEDVKPTEFPESTTVITTFTFDRTSITTVPTVSSTIIRRSTTSCNENSSEEDNHSSTKSTTLGSTTMLKSSSITESRTKTVTSTIDDNISTVSDKIGGSSEEDNQPSTKSKEMSTTLGSTTMLKSSSITKSRTKPVTSTIVNNISSVSDKNGGSSEEDNQPSTQSEKKSTTLSSATSSITESRTKSVTTTIVDNISTVSDKNGGSSEEDTHSSTKSKNKPTTAAISTLFKSSPIEENGTKFITNTTTENISTVSDERGEYTVSDESTFPTKFPEKKDTDSTIKTSSFTDFVTSHIFCPEPNGYFPHPSDRHKFIACVGGSLIIMECPENLIYNHKRKSCEYEKMLV